MDENNIVVFLIVILLIWLFITIMRKPDVIDEFSNYGPEYSTNNPEYAPWDISSPFYTSFWGYDRFYNNDGYYNVYGW